MSAGDSGRMTATRNQLARWVSTDKRKLRDAVTCGLGPSARSPDLHFRTLMGPECTESPEFSPYLPDGVRLTCFRSMVSE